MSRFASLTSRLVVTAVALVALVSLLIGTATTLAMRSYLTDQIDGDVLASVAPLTGPDGPPGSPGDFDLRNQPPGTLNAFLPVGGVAQGEILTDRRSEANALSAGALATLAEIPTDGDVHAVDVPGQGSYRLTALEVTRTTVTDAQDGVLVTGLPTDDVDDAVASLVWWELALTLVGVLAAAGLGRLVVRRQLRPLREVAATAHHVAELPLASGDIELTERVPDHLTDERTEVGQVGSALNTLLEHVESSLSARQRSELQVRQFVADASHELRTPLATIKGYAELARRRPDDPAMTGTALGKVEAESVRMTALVEDLLLLARLDAGRPLERRPVDLTRLLLEAVADARVLGPDHRWRLDLPDEALEVAGDEQRLHQMVSNLLTNARKHTPAGTTVTVSARAGQLAVRDDGPGFPPDLRGKEFERFARGDTARTRGATEGGTGLGLALVKAIATAHAGEVTLESRPGDTTVTVRLPKEPG